MPPRKRAADSAAESTPKRRSSRHSTVTSAPIIESDPEDEPPKKVPKQNKDAAASKPKKTAAASKAKPNSAPEKAPESSSSGRGASPDPDVADIPTTNPEAPRHDGEWYWLMKAEPETRLENGIDVRFSIDDLRAKTEPEGWDGIRAYAARNHMRNMNAGDKAFFYHSNCKEPGIAGIMEIVKEFSEDRTARRPGTPYYDPQSTKEKPRWSLVHVEFRKKFAVPITLKELREMGAGDGPLKDMQMLKQSRLSVSRVGDKEFKHLCKVADEKAKKAGLKHEQ